MQVPEHVRTTTAAYVAGASCALGSMGVYLLLSHRTRKLKRDHEDEIHELEVYWRGRVEKATRQLDASHKVNRPGTWVGALRDTLGSGVVASERELEGVGPDGQPLAIEGNSSSGGSHFLEASSVPPSDGALPDEAAAEDHGVEPTDANTDSRNDSPVQGEEPVRVDGKPYVISTAEFYEDKETYQKLSVTYYSRDRVLVDEHDQPVPDIQGTIGPSIKRKFGQKSDDPQIVHIRNDHLEVDFEVRHDERSYKEVVLGYGDPTSVGAKNAQAEE